MKISWQLGIGKGFLNNTPEELIIKELKCMKIEEFYLLSYTMMSEKISQR